MESRRHFAWLVALVIGLTVAILSFQRTGNEGELLGIWKVEYGQVNGSPRRRARELWVFRPGGLTIVGDDQQLEFRTTVKPETSPKEIDAHTFFRGPGIYKVAADELQVIFVPQMFDRPTSFTTELGDMRLLTVLRRLKTQHRLSAGELSELLAAEFGPAKTYPEPVEFDQAADEFVGDRMRELAAEAPRTELELMLERIFWLITEIDNGGMHQYFWNSSGEFAVETVEDLRKIGAPNTAKIIETACSLFPERRPSKDFEERRSQLKAFSLDQLDVLHDLEQQFYTRREDLNVLLRDYWMKTAD